jgi:aspartate/methionine/tyrosine aminotransferase
MKSLSQIAHNIDGQPMFKILDKAQKLEREGKEILHFELGEPDFDTPKNIVDSACNSLLDGETHYTSSLGLYDFRLAVQETTLKSRGFKPSIEQILVTPGANSIIYFAIKCLVNPGEEVIVPDPGFPTYFSAIKACDAIAVPIRLKEENQFRLDANDLENAITEKTRLIILNTPSNPTGSVMTPDEIKKVAEICEKHDIYLLSDEIYGRLIFNNSKSFLSPSYIDKCKERTIIINGFSKAFAMTGWRLGVAIGPEIVIEKMGLLVSTIVSCVPTFIQRAGIEAILGDQTAITHMKNEYDKRRKILVDGLNSIDGITCIEPDGAIYAFPNITGTGMSSDEFANFALEKAGVALLPGNNFGDAGEGYVRICYVNTSENIEKAIEKIKQALKDR